MKPKENKRLLGLYYVLTKNVQQQYSCLPSHVKIYINLKPASFFLIFVLELVLKLPGFSVV